MRRLLINYEPESKAIVSAVEENKEQTEYNREVLVVVFAVNNADGDQLQWQVFLYYNAAVLYLVVVIIRKHTHI